MLAQLTYLAVTLLIVLMMLLIRMISSKYSHKENMSFECGFESFKNSRVPFSLNFFMIGLIFVLFDLEIIILVASIPSISNMSITIFYMMLIFFLFMLLSLLLEWNLSKLNWIF